MANPTLPTTLTITTQQVTSYSGSYYDATAGATVMIADGNLQLLFDSGGSLVIPISSLPQLAPLLTKVLSYIQANYPALLTLT